MRRLERQRNGGRSDRPCNGREPPDKLYDEDAGMYYFNARWYYAEIGRFITEDPARDGVNWYAYCGGNPVKLVDNDGCIADYFWDAASLATGAVSFGYNIPSRRSA